MCSKLDDLSDSRVTAAIEQNNIDLFLFAAAVGRKTILREEDTSPGSSASRGGRTTSSSLASATKLSRAAYTVFVRRLSRGSCRRS